MGLAGAERKRRTVICKLGSRLSSLVGAFMNNLEGNKTRFFQTPSVRTASGHHRPAPSMLASVLAHAFKSSCSRNDWEIGVKFEDHLWKGTNTTNSVGTFLKQ